MRFGQSPISLRNKLFTYRQIPTVVRTGFYRATMASIASDIKEVEVMNDSDLKDGEK